jgi:hypothetical protein
VNAHKTNEVLIRDWADDHSAAQHLAKLVGCDTAIVNGDSYGVPSIGDLLRMIKDRVCPLVRDEAILKASLETQKERGAAVKPEIICPTCARQAIVIYRSERCFFGGNSGNSAKGWQCGCEHCDHQFFVPDAVKKESE